MKCYRCNSTLVQDSDNGDMSSYLCQSCGAAYAKKGNSELHDRWLMPITIPLYSVLFEKEPLVMVNQVVADLAQKDSEYIDTLINHIQSELESPQQKVSEIHDYIYPNEEKLREFLKQVMVGLQETNNYV